MCDAVVKGGIVLALISGYREGRLTLSCRDVP